jgi:pimeloyl-ACP methyl ester carboxylesterase
MPRSAPPASDSSRGGSAWKILRDSKTLSLAGRWARSHARSLVIREFGTPERRTRFGLDLDAGWEKTPLEKGLVVFIHGYQSLPERHSGILKDVRASGIPCALLRYPNDQPLDKSAALLAAELGRIAAAQPDRPVTILALSMGGLIARAVIEDPVLDAGNVRRLIMVATPNQGSRMAQYTVGADLFEFLIRRRDGSLAKRLYASVEDGLGEAAEDLRPGSDFLTGLNARKRNPAVQYSLFLGTGGPLDEKTLERWRERAAPRGEHGHIVRFVVHEIQRSLEDLDEVLEGKGDGAVAVKRGRLEGVEDTTLIGFRHYQLMDGETEAARQLRSELLNRLTK